MEKKNLKKLTVVGAGNVGASLAQIAAYEGIADVVLLDIVEGMPQGKALDMGQACCLWGSSSIVTGTNDYKDTVASDIVVITAGLARKPGMSRDDLLIANAGIVKTAVQNTCALSPGCIFIIVTNPMDVMAHIAKDECGFPQERVIGMGGVLDSARFRTFIAWEAGVSVKDVESLVMGGHGDQMVPLPSKTTIKGIPITEILQNEKIQSLINRTKNGGAEIVGLLKTGSAYYAPAASAYEMVRAVLLDEKRLLPCSVMLSGQYGINGTYTGVPVVLGAGGVQRIMEIDLTDEEKSQLLESASNTKTSYDKIKTI